MPIPSIPDLGALRRLALVVGVLAITWALAGITLVADSPVTLFGVPFRITRGDLLPVGLALASFYLLVRFYYYGMMLGTSPYRMRRDILDELVVEWTDSGERPKGKVTMYGGPTRFTTTPWRSDHALVQEKAGELRGAFPKVWNARVAAEVSSSRSFDDDGEEYWTHAVTVTIPIRCRIGALVEDVDYTLPVWLNTVALLLLGLQGTGLMNGGS